MKQILLVIFLFLFYPAVSSSQSPGADSLTAHNILYKAIDAQGGTVFLKSVRTIYTNTVTIMDGIPVNWVVKEMLPNKEAFQVVNNNRILYQSWFDGENGFEIVNGKKRRQYTDELSDKLIKKNIISELDYVDSSLWTVRLAGEEKILNQLCYKLHARSANGIVKNLFYSKETFLLLKEERIISPELVLTYFFMSFARQGEFTFCNEMKLLKNGKYQEIKILDLVINEKVNEEDFR